MHLIMKWPLKGLMSTFHFSRVKYFIKKFLLTIQFVYHCDINLMISKLFSSSKHMEISMLLS